MTPTEAREYIGRFHLIVGAPNQIKFVEMEGGKQLRVDNLTDEDAVRVAEDLQSWERKAAEISIKKGARLQ